MLLKVWKQWQFWLLLSVLLQLRDISGTPNNAPGEDITQCVNEEEFEEMKGTLESNSQVLANIQNQFAHFQDQLANLQANLGGQFSNVQGQLINLQNQLAEHISMPPRFPNGSFLNPAPSCKYVEQGSPSGWYWIRNAEGGYATQVYCDMTRECCGSRGGWMRVAHLDMTHPNQQCPPRFRMITSPRRMCGRPGRGCVSTTFPVNGAEYRKVCGRIIAYQYYSTNAFEAYYNDRQRTIDSVYVDGVSITHGYSPRKHIWTFAAAWDETRAEKTTCPCTRTTRTYTGRVPPFIGQDYFCETGSRYTNQNRFYTEDPLWDGRRCGSVSTCCRFNNPPWFCKELPQPTTEDIELRLCSDQDTDNEDSPIELIELFVQ